MAAGHSELTYIWLDTHTITEEPERFSSLCFNYCCGFINTFKKEKKIWIHRGEIWASPERRSLFSVKPEGSDKKRVSSSSHQPHTGTRRPHVPGPRSSAALGAPSPVWPLCIFQTRITKGARGEPGGSYSRCQQCGTPGDDEQVTVHGRHVMSPKH